MKHSNLKFNALLLLLFLLPQLRAVAQETLPLIRFLLPLT